MTKGFHGKINLGNNVHYTSTTQSTVQLAFQKLKQTHTLFKKPPLLSFSYLYDPRTLIFKVHLLTSSTDSLERNIILNNLYCI